jgi:hypothetical protein
VLSEFTEFFWAFSIVRWLRLALSKGPNWVGVFSPTFTWGLKQIQFPKRVFWNTRRWKESRKIMWILYNIHHRQNPFKSISVVRSKISIRGQIGKWFARIGCVKEIHISFVWQSLMSDIFVFSVWFQCVESARQHLKSCLPPLAEEAEECILRSVLQACNTLIVLKQTKSELVAEKHG